MNNEETVTLNGLKNPVQKEQKSVEKKQGGGVLEHTAATAGGAALGAGAAIAVEHVIEAATEEPVVEDVQITDPEEVQEAVGENASQEAEATPTSEPVVEHVVVEHHVYAHTPEAPRVSETPAQPDESVHQAGNELGNEGIGDNEVRVIGIAIEDNGNGGVATYAGLQRGDEIALVLDVESDGTIDFVATDDNGNGHLEAEELRDVSGENYSTAAIVEEYVEESQREGVVPTALNLDNGETLEIIETEDGFSLENDDTSFGEDELYIASDDMPDYQNDADVSFVDA